MKQRTGPQDPRRRRDLGGGIALAHVVDSRSEVEQVIEVVRRHSAEITREPSETFYGGYAGRFRDLDGHVWEVACGPSFGLTETGIAVVPAE
jgi:hypothetical protein